MLDTNGTVRVLNLGMVRVEEANDPFHTNAARTLAQNNIDRNTINYMAPELARESDWVDQRADIYSLGCTLYFVLTAHEPFPGASVSEKLTAHRKQDAPSLRATRPDVSMALEACYQKMMAKRPDDRPRSMTDVIALLQASKLPPDGVTLRAVLPARTGPGTTVSNETPRNRPGRPRIKAKPSIVARREEHEGLLVNHEFNLEDLVMEVRPDVRPGPDKPPTTEARPLRKSAIPALRGRFPSTGAALFALATTGLLVSAFVLFFISRRRPAFIENDSRPPLSSSIEREKPQPEKLISPVPTVAVQKTIFDGTSGQGWMLCNRVPVSPQNVQPDGLNPHGSGSYLVVYNQKLGDFVLDFDYKLSAGCNSGVFLRVGDLTDPVQTGIEVALDDNKWGDDRDSGAIYGLVAPTVYAQKPAGRWNHMTITAQGPRLAVSLNETEVSSINLDLWTVPGKRPDGSDHRFKDRAVAGIARTGYMGFQDLGGDCWFKNIVLKLTFTAPTAL